MNPNNQNYPMAEITDLIKFHGSMIFVYQVGDVQYIPIKPVSDIIGIDWRNVKRNLNEDDNKMLYGVLRICTPVIDNLGGLITPQTGLKDNSEQYTQPKSSKKTPFTDILCTRFDRVHMFLARVNTSRVRANGNIDSADFLLKLQIEWAEAIHNYEAHGIAIKQDKHNELKTLTSISKNLFTAQQKLAVSKQIDKCLGINAESNKEQPDIFKN